LETGEDGLGGGRGGGEGEKEGEKAGRALHGEGENDAPPEDQAGVRGRERPPWREV
jgi:hypothetical protein